MAPYEPARNSTSLTGRAVVLGGGLAGLLAARVLTDTFEQVMIIERRNWSAVRLVNAEVLSKAAQSRLDWLFPGLFPELVADGAAIVAPAGRPQSRPASTAGAERADARLQFTQRFIHCHLSRRLKSFDGVVMLDGCDAVGLVSDGGRCVGVHVLPRNRSAAARTVSADLVVDAMGAGSRLCLWVGDLWGIFGLCDQQTVTHYASRWYQPQTGSLPVATKIDLRPAHPYRAVVMAVEAGQYVLTIAGPNLPPDDGDQFDQLLRVLLPQQVAATVVGGRPAGPVIISASPRMRTRCLDQADNLPPNIVALGDSLCSFDPLEGQGFEAAVREAGILWQLLGEQHPYADNGQPIELSRRYFRAVAKIVDGAWTMGA